MSLFSIAAKFALKGASKRVPEDIMSGTIRRIKQEAQLPEFKREAWWKDPERVKKGLESVDTAKYKEVDETIDTLSALGKDKTDIDLYRKPIKEGGQKLPQKQSDLTKSEELEEAARTLQDRGSTYQETFKEIRDRVKPKEPYGKVPAVKTEFDIAASLPGKSYERGIIGVNRNLKQGEEVGARFDINAYNWFNTYVATITKKVKGVDKVFGYGPTAVLRDVKFDMVGPEAFKVAQGAGKKPFARFYGKWQDMNPKAAQQKAIDNIKSKEWVEVGFDPSGRGGFYRRDTGDVVGAAEEVIQVGPMLLAKGLKVPTKEQLKKLVVKTNVDSIVFDNKHGGKIMAGGLSNLKKSININGQPHSLAWINPGEASALRAMGGSGKKVEGIPAYFDYQYDPSMGDLGEFGGLENYDPEPPQTTTISDDSDSGDTTSDAVYAAQQKKMLADADAMERQYGDAYALQRSIDEESPTGYLESYGGGEGITSESLMKKGIPKKLVPYWNALKDRGLSNEEAAARLSGMGTSGLASMEGAYDTGYSFGGPMGTMEGIQRDIASDYAKKLKLKEHLEKLEGLEGKELSEEDMETRREELISAFRDHAKEIGGKFIPSTKFGGIMSGWEDTLKRAGKEDSLLHKGLGYLAPGALMTKIGARGLNALTKAFGVIGEFITPEGLSYRVMDDGTLVAPDTYADTDEGTVERKPIRRPPPLAPPPEPLEQKLTGMEAHYANLPKAASRQASLQSQFDILAATYGREQAAALLNQPVNIFA